MLSSIVILGSKDGALRPILQPQISLSEGTASATQQDIARLIWGRGKMADFAGNKIKYIFLIEEGEFVIKIWLRLVYLVENKSVQLIVKAGNPSAEPFLAMFYYALWHHYA